MAYSYFIESVALHEPRVFQRRLQVIVKSQQCKKSMHINFLIEAYKRDIEMKFAPKKCNWSAS